MKRRIIMHSRPAGYRRQSTRKALCRDELSRGPDLTRIITRTPPQGIRSSRTRTSRSSGHCRIRNNNISRHPEVFVDAGRFQTVRGDRSGRRYDSLQRVNSANRVRVYVELSAAAESEKHAVGKKWTMPATSMLWSCTRTPNRIGCFIPAPQPAACAPPRTRHCVPTN